MSILQEYEVAKKIIGKERWDSFDTYINTRRPDLLLDQIIYNPKNWNDFEIWFQENIKLNKIEVLDFWKSDFDDLRCNAIIYKGNYKVANITEIIDEDSLFLEEMSKRGYRMSNNVIKDAIKVQLYKKIDEISKKPKISETSNLMQSIYNEINTSISNNMYFVSEEQWNDFYSDYSDKDFELFKNEVKEYNLENVIAFNNDDSKITVYANLETKFNNDLSKEKTDTKEWEIVTHIKDLNQSDNFIVSRVINKNYCAELHYNKGKPYVEFSTKVSSNKWINKKEEAGWFNIRLEDYDVLFMLDSLFDKRFIKRDKHNDFERV